MKLARKPRRAVYNEIKCQNIKALQKMDNAKKRLTVF